MSETRESKLTADIEDLKLLKHHLSRNCQGFVMSVLDYHARKGYVTENQAKYVEKYAAECRLKEANKTLDRSDTIEEIFDGSALRKCFDRAFAFLKYPKLTIPDATLPGRKVFFHRASARSRTPGWIICSNGKKPPEYYIYATVDLAGEGQIVHNIPASIKTAIRKVAANPVEAASAVGRATGVCSFCNLSLTHATSLHYGYGPICADKYGLPWDGDRTVAMSKEVELYPIDGLDKLGLEDL